MGRDINAEMFKLALLNFNSRARMGRDKFLGWIGEGFDISIHAPAWGATLTPKCLS